VKTGRFVRGSVQAAPAEGTLEKPSYSLASQEGVGALSAGAPAGGGAGGGGRGGGELSDFSSPHPTCSRATRSEERRRRRPRGDPLSPKGRFHIAAIWESEKREAGQEEKCAFRSRSLRDSFPVSVKEGGRVRDRLGR